MSRAGWTRSQAGFADPDGQAPAGLGDYQAPADPAAGVRAAAATLDAALRAGAAQRPLRWGSRPCPGTWPCP